jgi:uncharacterized protein YbbC (DUF1343 family)
MSSPHAARAAGGLLLLALLGVLGLFQAPVLARGRDVPSPRAGPAGTTLRGPVLPGLEVLLRDSIHLVAGKRVGLITNPTALARDGRHAVDLLHAHPEVRLAALYGPEHGLRGGIDAGVRIADGIDDRTGVPVFSLYGTTLQPTPQMLRGVDVLLFDMQDIGARTYTYVWTMTLAMEAAAARGIPFVVLDRPNPITARAAGLVPSLEALRTGPRITGHYPVPFRHGMTPGEIARYVNREHGVHARLSVVPAEGWQTGMWFDETGLPWVDPSPNIRTLEAALNFAGLGMLEAVNLSLGRGTDAPFSLIGAPWLDHERLLRRLLAHGLEGVELEPTTFVPRGTGWMQFRDEQVRGVRIRITDRERYDPVLLAVAVLVEVQRAHPQHLGMRGMRHVMGDGAADAIRRGDDPRAIVRRWQAANTGWEARVEPYRLYGSSALVRPTAAVAGVGE